MQEREDRAGEAGGTWVEDGDVGQDQSEDDHDDAGSPSNDVEQNRVGVLAHQIAAIDQEKDEDQDDRQPDAVPDLRVNQNFPKRRLGNQDDPEIGRATSEL